MSTDDREGTNQSAQENPGSGKGDAGKGSSRTGRPVAPLTGPEKAPQPPRTVKDLNRVELTLYNAALLDLDRGREFVMGSMMGLSVLAEGMNSQGTLQAMEELSRLQEAFGGVSMVVVTAFEGGKLVPVESTPELAIILERIELAVDRARELYEADRHSQGYGELMSCLLNTRSSLMAMEGNHANNKDD